MHADLEINLRHMASSPALEQRIRNRAKKLGRFCDDIQHCHVVVDAPHRHHHKGRLYHVKISVNVPNEQIVVHQKSDDNHAYEDVYVAIRDAFATMRRRLEDYMRRRRGLVKHHETPPHGRIAELYPFLNYGRILTPDGREIYFHRNSVSDGDFDELEVGAEVRFSEEAGDLGPRATSVHVVGKHHIH